MLTAAALTIWTLLNPTPAQEPVPLAIPQVVFEPVTEPTQRKPKSASLKLPTMVFAFAAGADAVTTYRNLSAGGNELNYFLKDIDHTGATIAVSVAADVVGVWAWNRYVGRKHPKLAKVGLYAASALRFFVAARNHHRYEKWRHSGPRP
jgi:hypothetical protein